MLITFLYWAAVIIVALLLLAFAFLVYSYRKHMSNLPKPDGRMLEHKPVPGEWSDSAVTFTWVGHSTILIRMFGTKILTDPVLGEQLGIRIAGVIPVGPKRFTPPALQPEEIGEVDLILLSHAHMDHIDLPTLRKLATRNIDVITAKNTSGLLRRMPFKSVAELEPGQTVQTADGLTITAIPVRHWGNRFPWNTDYGYNGYIIEKNGVRILYPGDTAYISMSFIREQFGPIDLAFMPIGAYKPDSYQRAHCTPEQAWQMFKESGAKWLVPIHHNTFVLSQEPVDEPLERLLTAAGAERDKIVVEKQGETYTLPTTEQS
ncbi:MBL fold metallo-hydrolase [Brevibacillus sp. TJ4]|uniref:MBL fold metallo-hydrolase n=1 Tax=Brevibacillus sp. TJ4 TaxID=3234853 RepID=UPI0037CE1739